MTQEMLQASGPAVGKCPFIGATPDGSAEVRMAPTGCPVSVGAAAFDVFEDPAKSIRPRR